MNTCPNNSARSGEFSMNHQFRTFAIALLTVLFAGTAMALAPRPADPQSGPIALSGGTAHLGNGAVIEDALVTFDGGRITAVLDRQTARVDLADHRVIDTTGQHIYPGFILPDTKTGLREVDAVRASVDDTEKGELNPNVRSLIAFNTDSEMIPTLRFNGILTAQVSPSGGLVSGTSSIVQLDAWNWEDAALQVDDGLFVNWPAKKVGRFSFATVSFNFVPNKDYDEQLAGLTKLFQDAIAFAADNSPVAGNLKLAAMQGLFDGSKRLYIKTSVASDIVLAVNFAESMGVMHPVVITRGAALQAAEFLAEHQVPVIVDGIHNVPAQAHHDIDAPYRLPAELVAAGVKVGMAGSSFLMNSRNLAFYAGTAAAHGLGKEQALRMITLSTAEILGVADRLGSLETGKNATLFVSSGDALDMRGNQLQHAFIDGREVQLEATQQQLHQRFHEKYSAAQ
jgi:imidazolonepropionase-like amidohydrolase